MTFIEYYVLISWQNNWCGILEKESFQPSDHFLDYFDKIWLSYLTYGLKLEDFGAFKLKTKA